MFDKSGKIIGIAAAAIGTAFVGLSIAAQRKKAESVYDNKPEEKNLLEGKKVEFVADESEKENADGVKGHLVAVGEEQYNPEVYEKYVKRGLDKILSFGGLVALSPVMGAIALAIKIEDPGPVLFTQKRVGQNKQYFKLHKFRSMRMDTPHDVPTHMLENPEQYITKVGKFIRKHSLDELPQIWDIFMGNMSVIGPRPALWNQDLLTAERDKYNANNVKPGLTGWAQINGRDELEIPDKAKLDGEYVKNLSLKMDAKCFLGSLHVFNGDSSVVEGGTGELKRGFCYRVDKGTVDSITGKKILFFSPAFFNYENLIADKMREMGAEVDAYDVRSVTSAKDRALLKINPGIFKHRSEQYYGDIIEQNKNKDYDYILIVKCDMTPVDILQKFRTVFPHAKLCLNLWDSMENIPGIEGKLKYFDTCHSFDPEDCESHPQLKFRPLFFADQFRKDMKGEENAKELDETENYDYDIGFLGTIHSDRYKVIKQIQKLADKYGLSQKWFLYLQSRFIYHFYKAIKKEFHGTQKSDFNFEKLSSEEIAAAEDEVKVVLDIQHPRQRGLTMRTIEMLGMNKKLITTNATIKNYDFYDPDNICVIDRNRVSIDMEFFKKPYREVDRDVYEQYSLETWIRTVLS